jgi:hypothetical protein
MFVLKHGDTNPFKDESGRIKGLMPFPQVATAHKPAAHPTRLEQEFVMTPSARTRINVVVALVSCDPEGASLWIRTTARGDASPAPAQRQGASNRAQSTALSTWAARRRQSFGGLLEARPARPHNGNSSHISLSHLSLCAFGKTLGHRATVALLEH